MRDKFNALPKALASSLSFILDTTTIRTYMPSMSQGDFQRWGKRFFNYHKGVFGGKLEVAVALQRHPLPIFTDFAPAGTHDLTMARHGIFRQMRPGELGLGDPGYGGHSLKIYAPPKRNERLYVDELDKMELTLQRRVEMANRIIKRFACLGSVYRKGAVHAYHDLELLCSLIPKIVFWDLVLNQDRGGSIHMTGPTQDKQPFQVLSKRRLPHFGALPRLQQVRPSRLQKPMIGKSSVKRKQPVVHLPGKVFYRIKLR